MSLKCQMCIRDSPKDILIIEGHLLSLAIRLLLLFLHLLSDVLEHLKELVFALLRWMDACDCSCADEESVSLMICSQSSIVGDRAPSVLAALLLVVAAL